MGVESIGGQVLRSHENLAVELVILDRDILIEELAQLLHEAVARVPSEAPSQASYYAAAAAALDFYQARFRPQIRHRVRVPDKHVAHDGIDAAKIIDALFNELSRYKCWGTRSFKAVLATCRRSARRGLILVSEKAMKIRRRAEAAMGMP